MDSALPAQSHPSNSFRESLADAIRFWEPRRILYNVWLALAALGWLIFTWPHFRPGFTLLHGFQIAVLALLANVCYCAAYFVDIPLQLSSLNSFWKRWRWSLWVLGTLFAFVLTNYWIADEIYPFVR
jgi:hypothetical protein